MDGPGFAPPVSSAQLQSLQTMAERSADNPIKGKTAEQVEGMFASLLIKSMRQTLGGEGLFPGDKSDALGSLFDQYLGEEIAQGGGLGLAQALESYSRNAEENSA